MTYALFFKHISSYIKLYTVRLGPILRPFQHGEVGQPEDTAAATRQDTTRQDTALQDTNGLPPKDTADLQRKRSDPIWQPPIYIYIYIYIF